jgi:putative ABC transport system substrate-binding protein
VAACGACASKNAAHWHPGAGQSGPAHFLKEIREALRELGYVEGESIAFEIRSAAGDSRRLDLLAAELVALKVDVIVAFQTPAATAAKRATTEIPIVMAGVGDPIGTGLVAGLARPGGNVTGMSGATAELGGKNLELIRESLSAARRVAVLANASDPFHKPFLENILASSRTLNFEIKPILIRGGEELGGGFAEMEKWRAEAVVVQPSLPHRRSAEEAIKRRLPAFAPHADFSAAGGLMSYSADQSALYRESASFVDKIIKGRKPADLPVQLAAKFLFIVNLRTAKALGLSVPPALLTRADQVIE